MNIKDPEVHRLAHLLARRRGTSATAAVRQALEEAMQREDADLEARIARLREIEARAAARPEPYLTDDDLYDERGLPK